MMKLHEVALSGNCHKVRLLLSMLGLSYESVAVDLAAGEHHTPAYLALNPFGEVPTLVDGDVAIRDSQAILVYLASCYGGERWWPQDPVRLAGRLALNGRQRDCSRTEQSAPASQVGTINRRIASGNHHQKNAERDRADA